VTDNLAGGVYASDGAAPFIVDCIFHSNDNASIYALSSSATIVNCLFRDNFGYSGAIQVSGGAPTIANCTFVGNESLSGGGAIVADYGSATVTNCVACLNTPVQFSGNVTASYSLVEGGYAGDGNIDADPIFYDPNVHDYRITGGSPCIDAGNNAAVPSGVTNDLSGGLRFVDDPLTDDTGSGDPPMVDMGAYEFQADITGLYVTPAAVFFSSGPYGGPFEPGEQIYSLCNYGDAPIEFAIGHDETWLDVDIADGTIPALSKVEIVASINEKAETLPHGVFEDTLSFVNETDHDGDTTRAVTLKVGVPVPVIVFNLDDDPGWTINGQWAFGQPTGQGGLSFGFPDPTAGATGESVFGINLNGDYSTNIGPWEYLTTSAIDCTGLTDVELHFQRWLNSDYEPYVYQVIEVSNDGETWTAIWNNGAFETADSNWSEQVFEIAALADDQPTLYIRWGHKVNSGGAWAYSGWNIDDVAIWGVTPMPDCPEDVTDDGQVNVEDLFAIINAWGACDDCPEDINGDGFVAVDDLFAVINAWGPCP
jgi:hypothetical protein